MTRLTPEQQAAMQDVRIRVRLARENEMDDKAIRVMLIQEGWLLAAIDLAMEGGNT